MFLEIFPKITQLQITRKLNASTSRKLLHGGRRWLVHDELLEQNKLDRKTIMEKVDSVPVPPTNLEDGATLVVGSPEGDACIRKWFCNLSVEARMRFRYSEIDSCAAAKEGVLATCTSQCCRSCTIAARFS